MISTVLSVFLIGLAAGCVTRQESVSGSSVPEPAVDKPAESVSVPGKQPAPVVSSVKTVSGPVAVPVRRYFRPAANETPVLPKITVQPPAVGVRTGKAESGVTDTPDRRSEEIRIIDRSVLSKDVGSDSFFFSAMVFRFDTANLTARLQFERVPNRPEFTALALRKKLFETFFPSEEFVSVAEKQISVPGGGLGFEIVVRAVSGTGNPLETLAGLLSLLLQRPIAVAESGSPLSPICEFSFACDPVMTFSSPNSYGMYTNAGGERVSFSFNLRNDSEVRFRLAY